MKQQLLPDRRWQVTDLWGNEEHFHVVLQLSRHTADRSFLPGTGCQPQPMVPVSGPPLMLPARLPQASTTREEALGREAATMKDNNDSERGHSSRLEGGPPRLLNAHPWRGLRPEAVHGQAQRISCLCYPRLGWDS